MNAFRALLLTDVVDSTQLSESLGDPAMGELWSNHDRVARDLLDVWRGREIDKTDGMLLLFDPRAARQGRDVPAHGALGAGHACFMEQPWVVDAYIVDFLKRQGLFG